ncbi:hypothetical protein HPG69_001263, partial [Diceros bicornis minor]
QFKAIEDIPLLQEAANQYNLQPKEQFGAWFQAMELLGEDESWSPHSSGPARFECSSRPRGAHHLPAQG